MSDFETSPPDDAELYQLLMENVTDYAIFAIDAQGRIVTWNAGAERILGYTEQEAVGQPAHMTFTPEDRAQSIPEHEMSTAAELGRSDDERWHLRKDGSRFWANGILTALYNEAKQLRGYVKILRDFTWRKQQDDLLKEREARLARKAGLLDLANDSLFAHDLNNRIIYWNHAAEVMYGYSREEAIGQTASQLLATEFPDSLESVQQAVQETGRWEGELIHTRKDGAKIIVASRWSLERNESGQPVAFLESNREITREKQVQEALRRDKVYIEALNDRLQWALTETHHRTKNNLQILSSLLDMMMDNPDKSIGPQEMHRLSNFVRAMAAIHDILTHEAKDYGQSHTVSSKEFLERLLRLLEVIGGRERRIIGHIQPARLTTRQATALALVINELVANAIKHSAGDVEVSFEVHADTGHVRVCDRGSGFPPDFNPVVAANTGLELVEMLATTDLAGEVLYKNRADGGACVTVTLPLQSG